MYNMAYALIIYFVFSNYPSTKDYLIGFDKLWGQMLSITTFTLTFFLNQAYALRLKCVQLSRRLQGRLHDIGMNLASHAARNPPSPDSPNEPSTYTPASRQILELMSRYIRLFNLLTYASFTRSHRPILTPRGMRRLVERGLMTSQEREVLVEANIPGTQRHSAILMWMIRLFREGLDSGHILGHSGFEQQTMEKFHVIRAQFGGIGDELQGRMPLAYAHIVQVLVDVILWLYPIMSFSIGMSPLLVILGTGILTISYQGLFDLAKQFLDPYDNENYGKGEDPLCVDTLIAETNAGSVRWLNGFNEMPFSKQKLQDGELQQYLLPTRGYTVEELAQMEEDKRNKDIALQEEKRLQEEEELRRLREESEASNMAAEDGSSDNENEEEQSIGSAVDNTIEDSENASNSATETTASTSTALPIEKQQTTVEVSENSDANAEIAPSSQDDSSTYEDAVNVRTVHKVTTLANGKPVSFEPSDIPAPTIPLKAVDSYLSSLSAGDDLREIPNGEEMAEEPGEAETQAIEMEKKVTEIGAPENEMMETIAVVNGAPAEEGLEALQMEHEGGTTSTQLLDRPTSMTTAQEPGTLAVNGNSLKNGEPTSAFDNLEGVGFHGSSDSSEPVGDLPGGTGNAEVGDADTNKLTDEVDSVSEERSNLINQTLAENEATEDLVESTTMTLEDFNEEVTKIMEAVEEEMLETEAILMAKPGYDVPWDYDENQLASKEDEDEVEEPEEEEDLEILGMDEEEDTDVTDSETNLVEGIPSIPANEGELNVVAGASDLVSPIFLEAQPPESNIHVEEARQQPKSPEEEAVVAANYAAIESLQERAFKILLDLGMVEETQ